MNIANSYTLATFDQLADRVKTFAKNSANFPLKVTCAGHSIEIQADPKGGFLGLVDCGVYGSAKTVAGALSAVKRRLQFLATTQPTVRMSGAELEARDADRELVRRARNI